MTWYKKSMPCIKDINPQTLADSFANIKGINSLYLWGDYVNNKKNPNTIIKYIDVLIKTSFLSDDLYSIIEGQNSPFSVKEDLLEDEGFNKEAVIFTKNIIKISGINPWVISKDNKVLHWGPILENKEELIEIENEAEKYATFTTNTNKKDLLKTSQKIKDKWDIMYNHYLNKYLKGIPKGWYLLNYKVNDILNKAEKLGEN